ncbi:MAG TPA: arylamine N-acetyltransferase [Bacillota bacterium]|nr:arylamine N-acetyltransferase [Bacillota bacterium]
MNVQTYLTRIKVDDPVDVDFESLARLQNNHVLIIPFENLDVMNGVHIPLNIETYYNKVVHHQRGGFCYELNGLFHSLLKALGFDNTLIGCTVNTGNGWGNEESHASQIVYLDQPYVVDVGFGDSARIPLPLNGDSQADISGNFRVIKRDDGYYHKQKEVDGKWQTKFRFLHEPRELADFAEACHYAQTSPNSHFTQRRLVTLATRTGRETLSANTLTTTKDDVKTKREIAESDIDDVLKNIFGIIVETDEK